MSVGLPDVVTFNVYIAFFSILAWMFFLVICVDDEVKQIDAVEVMRMVDILLELISRFQNVVTKFQPNSQILLDKEFSGVFNEV